MTTWKVVLLAIFLLVVVLGLGLLVSFGVFKLMLFVGAPRWCAWAMGILTFLLMGSFSAKKQ